MQLSAVGPGCWSYEGKTSMGGAFQAQQNVGHGTRLSLHILKAQMILDLYTCIGMKKQHDTWICS